MNKYETIFQNKDGSIKIPEENESKNVKSPSPCMSQKRDYV